MERVIRKILNNDVYDSSKEKRDELVANITALSMYLLEKSGHFEAPNSLDVETADIVGGEYGDKLMKISNNIFHDVRSNAFVNDIAIVAHEVCHFAQEYSRDKSRQITCGRNLVYAPDRFESLFYYIVQLSRPNLIQAYKMFGPKFILEMDRDLKDIYNYLFSFYQLQPFELEADDFSLELLKYIVKMSEKLELSSKENQNLQEIKSSLSLTNVQKQKILNLKRLRQDPKIVKKVRMSAIQVIQYLLANTNFRNELYQEGLEIELDSVTNIVLDVSSQYLELNYDDDYAKAVMNMLFKAKPNVVRDRYIFQIGFFTEFKFTNEQEEQIREILTQTGIDVKKLSFEELMEEKKKVVSEREDMMRKRNKPIRTFSFDQ